jgi:hypothetical protein
MTTIVLSQASKWSRSPARTRETCHCEACRWNDEMARLTGRLIQGLGGGVEVLGAKACQVDWDAIEAGEIEAPR